MREIITLYYCLILSASLFASNVNFETGWEYTQSTLQSFYIVETINIDGQEATGWIEDDSECSSNPYTCDVIGAFMIRDEIAAGQDLNGDGLTTSDAEVCVGWVYASDAGFTTILLLGDEEEDYTAGYMTDGELPSIIKIYDHRHHSVVDADFSNLQFFEYFQDCNDFDCDYCDGTNCIGNGVYDAGFEGEPFVDCEIDGDLNYCEGDDGWAGWMGNGVWDDDEWDDADQNGVCDTEEIGSWLDTDFDFYCDIAEDFTDCGYNDSEEYICEGDEGWQSGFGNGVYDPPTAGENFDDTNNNGVWDGLVQGELTPFGNNETDLFLGSIEAVNVFGCKDDGSYSDSPDSYTCPINGEYFLDLDDCSQNCNLECDAIYQSRSIWESVYDGIYDGEYPGSPACNIDIINATADDGSCQYQPDGDIQLEHEIIEGNNVEISWGEPESGTSPFYHHVRVFAEEGAIYSQFDPPSPILLENLAYSAIYTIEVTSTNFEYCTPLVTEQSLETLSMPAPGQVVVDNPVSGEGQMFLTWSPVEYASTYSIESTDGFVFDEVAENFYHHDELAPDTTIEYQVVAINMEGLAGLPSESVSGSTAPLSTVTLNPLVIGQGKLELSWLMDNGLLDYNNENFIYDIYMDGELRYEGREGVTYTANDLAPGQEYCFEIVPRVELMVDGALQYYSSSQSNEPQCAYPADISGWSIIIEAQLDAWGSELVVDEYNELGMKPDFFEDGSCGFTDLDQCATDGYDPDLDIPEPPVVGDLDWPLSLSFPHPEWNIGIGGNPQDYFTTDIRSLKDLSNSLEIWDGVLSCDAPGSGQLIFNYLNYVEGGGYPVYLKWDDQYSMIGDDVSINYVYSTPSENSHFKMIVGNQAPSVPTTLVASKSEDIERAMDLNWDPVDLCVGSSDYCNEYKNRYPPHTYKIYRGWYEEIEPHLIGFSGTKDSKMWFFPEQLFAPTEELFSIVSSPEIGYIGEFNYESTDDCLTAEGFLDCGWDGLCEGDQGYDPETFDDANANGVYDLGEDFVDYNENGVWDANGPDIGEGDGVCNKAYYYTPYSDVVSGDDVFSYANGIYDVGEEFTDCNDDLTVCDGDVDWDSNLGNAEWDAGEPYIDSREISIRITESLESYFMDTELKTGTIYNYNISAVNDAGESGLSIMDSEQTEDNFNPIADAGVEQVRYIVSDDQDYALCRFPLDFEYPGYEPESGQPVGPACAYEVGCNYDGSELEGGPLEFEDILPNLDEDGDPVLIHENNSYDPDGLSSESLSYLWEIYDPWNSLENTCEVDPDCPISLDYDYNEPFWHKFSVDEIGAINLPHTTELGDSIPVYYNNIEITAEYLIRLSVKDFDNYPSAPSYTKIRVSKDIPPPAAVEWADTPSQESLYYIKLNWLESEWDGDEAVLEGYDGILTIASDYIIYRDSEPFDTIDAYDEDGLPVTYYVDEGLTPQDTFIDCNEDCSICEGDEDWNGSMGNGEWDLCEVLTDDGNGNGVWDATESHDYKVVAFNSSPIDYGWGAGIAGPSEELTFTTGELPIPVITSPTGGEILVAGDNTLIQWDIAQQNVQFIDNVGLYHSEDAGLSWMLLDEWDFNLHTIPSNFDFSVPVMDTISFYNKFLLRVTDKGDYWGENQVVHTDTTNHLIIIANDELQKTFGSGWNLISSPLYLEDTTILGNFDGEDDDFGDFFIFNYSENEEECGIPSCAFEDFYFQTGEGYYINSGVPSTLGLTGTLQTEGYTLSLDEGWNLIGNPLVARVVVDSIMVGVDTPIDDCCPDPPCEDLTWVEAENNNPASEGQCYTSWDVAVNSNFVLPTVHSYDSELYMHTPQEILEPFSGYWIHASSPRLIRVEPNIYQESLYSEQGREEDAWILNVFSEAHNPDEGLLELGVYWSDMVKLGLSNSYSDSYRYGEDEFSIPVATQPPTYTDMYISQLGWEEDFDLESDQFYSDLKSLDGISSTVSKSFDITGQILGSPDLMDSVLISWTMQNEPLVSEHVLSFIAGETVVNMRAQNSVTIHKDFFEANMRVVVGPLVGENSCETLGYIECPDGSCAESLDECVELSNIVPEDFSLSMPYPNPFNPVVKIDYSLPANDNVSINVYDISGGFVQSIESGLVSAGFHEAVWSAEDYPSGMYFIQFLSSYENKTMKIMLVK